MGKKSSAKKRNGSKESDAQKPIPAAPGPQLKLQKGPPPCSDAPGSETPREFARTGLDYRGPPQLRSICRALLLQANDRSEVSLWRNCPTQLDISLSGNA